VRTIRVLITLAIFLLAVLERKNSAPWRHLPEYRRHNFIIIAAVLPRGTSGPIIHGIWIAQMEILRPGIYPLPDCYELVQINTANFPTHSREPFFLDAIWQIEMLKIRDAVGRLLCFCTSRKCILFINFQVRIFYSELKFLAIASTSYSFYHAKNFARSAAPFLRNTQVNIFVFIQEFGVSI
jgi:hypothetical protein